MTTTCTCGEALAATPTTGPGHAADCPMSDDGMHVSGGHPDAHKALRVALMEVGVGITDDAARRVLDSLAAEPYRLVLAQLDVSADQPNTGERYEQVGWAGYGIPFHDLDTACDHEVMGQRVCEPVYRRLDVSADQPSTNESGSSAGSSKVVDEEAGQVSGRKLPDSLRDLDAGEDPEFHEYERHDLESEAAALLAEVERLRALVGMHDPTGADHMEDAARLAVENDELRALLRRCLRVVALMAEVLGDG